MNFAVVEIAGKQFLTRKGDVIETPKIPGAAGKKVTFESVLLHWDGKKVSVGRPALKGFAVEGRILEFDRTPKVLVYKFKRRKDYHRKQGHRQDFVRVEIEKIVTPGKPAAEKEKPAAEKKSPGTAKAAPAKKKPAAGEKTPARKKPAAGKKTPAGKKTAPRKKPAASGKSAGSKKTSAAKKSGSAGA